MSSGLVDAHAHLCAAEFREDLEAVLAAAAAAGVVRIITVGETLEDAEVNLALAERFPQVKVCAGLYPTILDIDAAAALIAFIRARRDRLVGIGEVGLDHWIVKGDAERDLQRRIFADFSALAGELDLPLNVHSRSAGRATVQFLKEQGARRVLLHAFDGKASAALEGAAAGFFFSIPPSVVRSPQKQKLVRALPLDRLLLETDSPVLGPDPAGRNEPRNLSVACQAVADLKGVSFEEVVERSTGNALALFPGAFS
ncbi:MAG TPA: TatD family hydrolase [Candidatus Methylomirabilis sp.]|nr:TatD family hydrolase [Candidatus Methylomirabilis sp.]